MGKHQMDLDQAIDKIAREPRFASALETIGSEMSKMRKQLRMLVEAASPIVSGWHAEMSADELGDHHDCVGKLELALQPIIGQKVKVQKGSV